MLQHTDSRGSNYHRKTTGIKAVIKICRMAMPYGMGVQQAKRATRNATKHVPARLVKRVIAQVHYEVRNPMAYWCAVAFRQRVKARRAEQGQSNQQPEKLYGVLVG